MRRVIDTSAWIEWLTDSLLADRLAPDLPRPEECIVPTIVQFELAKWMYREIGEERSKEVIAHTMTCDVMPLSSAIALLAAELSSRGIV